jgi:hypothetical protein
LGVKVILFGSESPLPRANNSSQGAPVKNGRTGSGNDLDQQVEFFNRVSNEPQESEYVLTLPPATNPSKEVLLGRKKLTIKMSNPSKKVLFGRTKLTIKMTAPTTPPRVRHDQVTSCPSVERPGAGRTSITLIGAQNRSNLNPFISDDVNVLLIK